MAYAVRRASSELMGVLLAALAIAAASCSGGGNDAIDAPVASTGGTTADAAGAGGSAGADAARDVAPPADAGLDRVGPDETAPELARDAAADLAPDLAADVTPDARPDRGPLTQEERYREFLEDATATISSRSVACFHSPPLTASLPGPTSGLWVSLRNGFSTVNEAAATACLESIAKASCLDLAADALGAACSTVLTGHVANGSYCRIDDDCRDGTLSFCKFDFAMTCGSRCAPRAKPGEKCVDVCTPDAFCEAGATGSFCKPLLGEGTDCKGGQCGAGLFCQRTGAPTGKCRRIAEGVPCEGTWQCPGAFACLVPANATAGTCGPGRAAQEACRVLQSGGVTDSDCAPGLRCLPEAGGKLVCGLGHEIGQSCAVPEDLAVAGELCRVGYCKATSNGPVCAAPGKRDQACSDDNPCEAGLACPNGVCLPEEIPLGEPCGGGDERKCEQGSFCRLAASADAAAPDPTGVCSPLRPEKEACGLEECAPPADCQNDVCTRCL